MIGEMGQGKTARRPRFHPTLEQGQLIRLFEGGPVWTVVRVTEGAAYIKKHDWTIDEEGGVLAGLEGKMPAISRHAKVYPA